ncbi:phosphate acyltransferase PlsX [Candidatus Poribacteria bacterium]|nr:phosphate acyltransferase PlsX [Candidatus Poribacteria bacterium]
MKIAIDAMGGDRAPELVVEGAILASREYEVEIIFVGQPEAIEQELKKQKSLSDLKYDIVPASQVIEMGEHPVEALRKKKDSSIAVATRLIKSGEAEAVVSAGSTGAAMAAAKIILGPLKGIKRPAIATILPNHHGNVLRTSLLRKPVTVVIDAGANVDCDPLNLVEFAIMGQVYAEDILGNKPARVGLLSIGTEKTKGNKMTFETYNLLSQAPINFIGNVEGRDVVNGAVDVVVCDGFVGNILLKVTEGVADMIMDTMRTEFNRNIITHFSAMLVKPTLRRFKKRFDYSEYGGAPLLGVKGTFIIAHGGSSTNAIKNAVRVASEAVTQNVNAHIESKLK